MIQAGDEDHANQARNWGRAGIARRNQRLSMMGFRDETGSWYGLDNAAVIMPAVTSAVSTYLFRLSATIDEPIHLPSLQAALERVARRFSYFSVELRSGFFWHYLEPHEAMPRVEADARSPCQDFDMHKRGSLLFRVRARERTIACEFAHILTDGTGGLRFLKNLLAEYFRLRGTEAGPDPDLLDLDAEPAPEEYEDAYNRYFPEHYPHPDYERPAYHIASPSLPRGSYRVITGELPLAEALAKAKELGVTLTELLTAAYIEAVQAIWLEEKTRERAVRRHRIAIEVPVNMRKFLATKSNKNFSLFVHPEQDMRLGPREFSGILSRVHHYLRYEIDGPSMARHISRNVSGGRMLAIRVIPLVLKSPLMRFLYAYYGDNKVSGVLSNLGSVSMPGPLAARIERFDFIHAPSPVLKVKVSVLSWRDSLYISFGSLATSRELERLFLTRLRRLGLPVKVECNLEE